MSLSIQNQPKPTLKGSELPSPPPAKPKPIPVDMADTTPKPVVPDASTSLNTSPWSAMMQPKAPNLAMKGSLETLSQNYETVRQQTSFCGIQADHISRDDLKATANASSAELPETLSKAANSLLSSQAFLNLVDAAGGDLDGKLSRQDLASAQALLEEGHFLDELLDTASLKGSGERDGKISWTDLRTVIADPSVPQAIKSTIQLLVRDGVNLQTMHGQLSQISLQSAETLEGLLKHPRYAELSLEGQKVFRAIVRAEGDAGIQKLNAALNQEHSFDLGGMFLHSCRSKLSDPNAAGFIAKAMEGSLEHRLRAASHLVSLNQVRPLESLPRHLQSYMVGASLGAQSPDTASRLATFSQRPDVARLAPDDQLRSLRVIGGLSRAAEKGSIAARDAVHQLVRDRRLHLGWDQLEPRGDQKRLLQRDGDTLVLNRSFLPASDSPHLSKGEQELAVLSTVAELSRVGAGEPARASATTLKEDYSAWHTAHQAAFGKPPTVAEAAKKWSEILSPNGPRAALVHGERGFFTSTRGILGDAQESHELCNFLSGMLKTKVTRENLESVLNDASRWGVRAEDLAKSRY